MSDDELLAKAFCSSDIITSGNQERRVGYVLVNAHPSFHDVAEYEQE